MKFNLKSLGVLAAVFTAMGGAQSAFGGAIGVSGVLYLTAADQSTGVRVIGSTASTFALVNHQESVVAVNSVGVSTTGYTAGAAGSVYNLAGQVVTPSAEVFPSMSGFYIDGSTDGTSNYTVDFLGGNVVRMSSNWTNPSVLFHVSGNNPSGITYDSLDGTIWISDYLDSIVSEYSMTGNVLRTFDVGHFANTALAYDQTDNSLWLVNRDSSALQLEQYSLSGTALQTLSFQSLSSINVLGGEFGLTAAPEPSSWLLLAGGIGLIGVSRRRHWFQKSFSSNNRFPFGN